MENQWNMENGTWKMENVFDILTLWFCRIGI